MNNISPEFPSTPSTPISARTANIIWTCIGLAFAILLITIALFPLIQPPPQPSIASINEFASHIQDGSVRSIVVRGGTEVFVRMNNNDVQTVYKARESDLIGLLLTAGVTSDQLQNIEYLEQASTNAAIPLFQFIIAFVPAAIIIGLLWRTRRAA